MKEFEFYHGAVITSLIHHSNHPLKLSLFQNESNSSYVLNDTIGLYVKYSAKRMRPWTFTMQKTHLEEIVYMVRSLSSVYVILVCGEDGAVTLNSEEIAEIVSMKSKETEWIRISRTPRSEYSVKGSRASLAHKVGKNDLFKKILGYV